MGGLPADGGLNAPLRTDDLHQALKRLMAAIRSGDGEALRAGLAEVDRRRDALGDDAPPMLRHYLERRSYEKAIAFLEGRDESIEAGG